MDSSIDLSQPEIVNIGRRPNPKELDTTSNFNVDNSSFRRSAGFKPIFNPYRWEVNKPLKPLKNNSLSRKSEEVLGKVSTLLVICR